MRPTHATPVRTSLRILLAACLCILTLLLPYRARVAFAMGTAWLVHLPYVLFGKLADAILKKSEQSHE